MVLQVLNIRAMDLERIPREGSASSDPRDLPAPGVPRGQTVARDRLRRTVVLASPGINGSVHPAAVAAPAATTTELECKPLKVVDGKDVIDENGQTVDLATLLGGGSTTLGKTYQTQNPGALAEQVFDWATQFVFAFCIFIGIIIVDAFVCKVIWPLFFESQSVAFVADWRPKYGVFVLVALSAAAIPLDSITN
jgi:hypothetical protein